MSVIAKLASSVNRRDEAPNLELAKQIAKKKDKKAVGELVNNLNNKSKRVQNDCIKVLYEIGAINPSLISGYAIEFIALLDSKNNRLQWGVMTAINSITLENPKPIYEALAKIVDAADKGSVITRDYGVNILINLCSLRRYSENAFHLLMEQIMNSPTNQLPMYAERAAPVINENYKKIFVKTLISRLGEIDQEPKRKRIEKVIKKFTGK